MRGRGGDRELFDIGSYRVPSTFWAKNKSLRLTCDLRRSANAAATFSCRTYLESQLRPDIGRRVRNGWYLDRRGGALHYSSATAGAHRPNYSHLRRTTLFALSADPFAPSICQLARLQRRRSDQAPYLLTRYIRGARKRAGDLCESWSTLATTLCSRAKKRNV